MTYQLHPRDIWHHIVTHLDASLIVGSAILGSSLLLTAGGIERSQLRSYYFGGAVALAFSGKRGKRIMNRTGGMMTIIQDESLAGTQAFFKGQLNPNAQLVDASLVDAQEITPKSLNELGEKNTLIIGVSGSGKSTIAKALASRFGGRLTIVDPHNKRADWGNLPVIGGGRNFEAINEFLKGRVAEMDNRYKLRDLGAESYSMDVVIVDEAPAIAANCEAWAEFIRVMARESRKVLMPVVILAQDDNAKTLDLEGEAVLREGFDRLYLGKLALKRAKTLKNEVVITWLKQQNRPALLNDEPAAIKDLSDLTSLPAPPPTSASLPPAQEAESETTGNPPEGEASSEKEVREVPEATPPFSETLEDDDLLAEIARLKGEGWKQTQIIGQIWGLKKDKAGKYSGRAYRKARAEFKELTGE